MTDTSQTQPKGEKLRKAIKWISETQQEKPDKTRMAVLREAQIRFDLTPNECCFLEKNFSDVE